MSEVRADHDYYGTYLETVQDLRLPQPTENDHEILVRSVEALPDAEAQRRLVALLEAVNPNIACSCSELDKVDDGQAKVCAHHSSRVGWIVHQARQLMPPAPEA